MADSPWYAAGLRFACTRCGNCCTGDPGSVRVSDAEIGALARRLGLAESAFRDLYTRRLRGGDLSLREKTNGDCVLYDRARGCTVYEDRPRQCRTWPFWRSVVHSRERWDEEAEHCPGMNAGPLHDGAHIAATSAEDGTAWPVLQLRGGGSSDQSSSASSSNRKRPRK